MNNQYDDQVIKARDVTSSPVQSQRGTDERDQVIADLRERWPHDVEVSVAADMLRADAETIRRMHEVRDELSESRDLFQRRACEFEQQLRARDEEIAALKKDAERWAVVAAAARRGNFGEWVIFPDEPHDRGDVKAQFVLDIDAALQEKSRDA